MSEERDHFNIIGRWMDEHFEFEQDGHVSRSAMYNMYSQFCISRKIAPRNMATFGKLVRFVFPAVKNRRLGNRGNSKYHYYNIVSKEPIPEDLEIFKELEQVFQPIITSDSSNFVPDADLLVALDAYRCNMAFEQQPDEIKLFFEAYKIHVLKSYQMLALKQYELFVDKIKEFWTELDFSLKYRLTQDELRAKIGHMDFIMYEHLGELLVGSGLDVRESSSVQASRRVMKALNDWIQLAMEKSPMLIMNSKLDAAKKFTDDLKRKTSLNHLAQAARNVLSSSDQISQMIADWDTIDFSELVSSSHWVLNCPSQIFKHVEKSFKVYLKQFATLEFWISWLQEIVDQCLPNLCAEANCKMFLMKWSFFSSLIMRDLTIKSAGSFGSFHLLRLFFDEYVLGLVREKAEKAKILELMQAADEPQFVNETCSKRKIKSDSSLAAILNATAPAIQNLLD